ncbi:MAG: ribosomal L7Ae/L30e/S12e/Gadd45 family protein [Lachnospiraceae bacterium]|nr:ribosomal L7Ae/L30e/S12e/Gadd45 family protein [Lachnospiraceae bacterium]
MNDRVISMLGLANKAGRLICGEEMVLDFIRSGKRGIVIISTDASDNTKKLFHDKCRYYHIPIYEYGTRTDTGHVSMAISDKNFADSIKKLLD